MTGSASRQGAATVRVPMPSDCSIRGVSGIAKQAREHLAAERPVALDCTAVEIADISFVQFVVSARRSFAARELPFAMEGMPPIVLAAFARAAVPLPGTTSSLSGE